MSRRTDEGMANAALGFVGDLGEMQVDQILLAGQAFATMALVEQQRRTADALERIADRLETEPVNGMTTHLPYDRTDARG